jgi:hypothetical protein
VIRWWIALWDRRETPEILALVRIGVALVVLSDLGWTWALGLVGPLMSAEARGGLSGLTASTSTWFRLVGDGPEAAAGLHAVLVGASLCLAAGLWSRTSAAVVMLASAEWARILPDADRGIDTLLRNVLFVLALSRCGDAFSLDALWDTGRLRGAGLPVPAWPRRVLVLQIVVMYFTAGVQKYAQHWWPWGGWSALYVILQDWAVAAHDFSWLRHPALYPLTQVATAATIAWQWTYPVVLVQDFAPPWPAGRLRAWFVRHGLHRLWIAVGVWFHVQLALTMELGIFPYGMLALYWVFVTPDALPSWLRAVRTGSSPSPNT